MAIFGLLFPLLKETLCLIWLRAGCSKEMLCLIWLRAGCSKDAYIVTKNCCGLTQWNGLCRLKSLLGMDFWEVTQTTLFNPNKIVCLSVYRSIELLSNLRSYGNAMYCSVLQNWWGIQVLRCNRLWSWEKCTASLTTGNYGNTAWNTGFT